MSEQLTIGELVQAVNDKTPGQLAAEKKRAEGKSVGGRPRKKPQTQGPEQPPQEPAKPTQDAPGSPEQPESLDEQIKRLKAESQPVSGPQPQQPSQQGQEQAWQASAPPPAAPKMPFLVSGRLLIIMLDAMFSVGIAAVFTRMGRPCSREDLALTPDERKELEKCADEVASMLQLNPVLVLAMGMGSFYLGKIPRKQQEPLR